MKGPWGNFMNFIDKHKSRMNRVHCDMCRKGVNENDYLHNTRDAFNRFRIYQKYINVFLTKKYSKPVKSISCNKIFIPLHNFPTYIQKVQSRTQINRRQPGPSGSTASHDPTSSTPLRGDDEQAESSEISLLWNSSPGRHPEAQVSTGTPAYSTYSLL